MIYVVPKVDRWTGTSALLINIDVVSKLPLSPTEDVSCEFDFFRSFLASRCISRVVEET